MMVQSNSGITKDRARLISPVYNGTGATCHMTFKYHMFGASAGELVQISSCVERRKEQRWSVVTWWLGGIGLLDEFEHEIQTPKRLKRILI